MKKVYVTCRALCLAMTLLVAGCKQEEALKPSADAAGGAVSKSPESMSRQEQLAYYNTNLSSLGQVTARLAKDGQFRQLVYASIEERFDGDYNVLFKQLGEATLNGTQVLDQMQQASASGRVSASNAINAFAGISGLDFFPQVFIPNYESLKAGGKLGKKAVEIVIHPGDDLVNQAPGYVLNEAGELVASGRTVDADYLRENEVWVISLNERVNSPADIAALKATPKSQKAARTQAGPGFQFEWMRLKDHMESSFSGQNDIRFTGVVNYYNGVGGGLRLTPEAGCAIAKWSKSETEAVNDERGTPGLWKLPYWQFLEKVNTTQWQTPGAGISPATGDWCWFAIFEYDGWPEGIKETEVISPVSPNKTYYLSFRSAQSACAKNCLSTNSSSPYYMGGYESYYNTDRVEYNIIPK